MPIVCLELVNCPVHRYPNLKTVRELVYKRGFVKVDRRRTPLTENSIIENVGTRKGGGEATLDSGGGGVHILKGGGARYSV